MEHRNFMATVVKKKINIPLPYFFEPPIAGSTSIFLKLNYQLRCKAHHHR